MLIHGRLILTANKLMLDEVRSLLQKSLRRKETSFITQSAKELLGYDKDQLPWKSLTTFLFEDHCLSHASVLEALFRCYKEKNKKRAVEVLSHAYTCRVAACLPVVALDAEYDPAWVCDESDIEIPETEQRLVVSQYGQLDVHVILQHLKRAWLKNDRIKLISCLKLVSMMHDIEKCRLTQKGVQYLIANVDTGAPNIGHLVMSILYNATSDTYFKRLFKACFNLLSTPEVCVRLVVFTPVVQLIFKDSIREQESAPSLPWKDEGKLKTIPHWAVDKHTFRGKFGKGVSHLVRGKKAPPTGYEDTIKYEEFYGERPKSDLQTFFTDGCVCEKKSIEVNPYWDRTVEIYFEQAKSKQKTVRMTKVWYDELKKKQPKLFIRRNKAEAKKRVEDESDGSYEGDEDISKAGPSDILSAAKTAAERIKRKIEAVSDQKEEPRPKRQKMSKPAEPKKESAPPKPRKTSSFGSLGLHGPLLQLPTGSAKVYTSVDLDGEKVWKGPYRQNRLNITLFFHKAMEIIGDVHTLKLENKSPYLVFPLLKGTGATSQVATRGFYDAISKISYEDGQFIERDALGIVQLHRLASTQIEKLPVTIWAHFAYRFALNVGDSGLYNALTDKEFSFLYGIDMEENRMSVKGAGFLDLIFTKQPNKKLCVEIKKCIKKSKSVLDEKLSKDIDVDAIEKLAEDLDVEFDKEQFVKRMKQLQSALKSL